jgi:hypothetical protein
MDLCCSHAEHFAADDGARVHGFQQRAAPAVVEHQGAAIVGHPRLRVVEGGAPHALVVLRASGQNKLK